MSQPLSRAAVRLQLLMFVLVVLPTFSWMPLWSGPFCLLMAVIRLMIYTGRWSAPSRVLKVSTLTAAIILIIYQTGLRDSIHLTVGLLVLGLATKLMEIYKRRDAVVLIYVAILVQASVFLFYQSIAVAVYVMLTMLVTLAALQACYSSPRKRPVVRSMVSVGRLMLFGVPVLVVFFLLFPRIGPLWSVSLPGTQAKTGIGDEIAPGTITDLARSSETAFRVEFAADKSPPPQQLYWRVTTYDRYGNGRWTHSPTSEQIFSTPAAAHAASGARSYQVTFEASNRKLLAALDVPFQVSGGIMINQDRTLSMFDSVIGRVRYDVVSIPNYIWPRSRTLSNVQRQLYLQLPDDGNPRSRALADQWWNLSQDDPKHFIQQYLVLIKEKFTYTLKPPLLFNNRIDGFMFDTRRGYCEHFASSLVYMLRSVGVPSRVVAGYQGGEWNSYQHYLVVRQYSAHAWVEYFDDNQGWVRVDPTAAVAPERIEDGAAEYLADEPDYQADSLIGGVSSRPGSWSYQLYQRLDAINFAWNSWVLNYQDHQFSLMADWIKQLSLKHVGLTLFWSAIFALFSYLAIRVRRWVRGLSGDPVERELRYLLLRLERRGIKREPGQTLSRLSSQLTQWPELQIRFEKIVELYQRFRYADETRLRASLLRQLRACRRRL